LEEKYARRRKLINVIIVWKREREKERSETNSWRKKSVFACLRVRANGIKDSYSQTQAKKEKLSLRKENRRERETTKRGEYDEKEERERERERE